MLEVGVPPKTQWVALPHGHAHRVPVNVSIIKLFNKEKCNIKLSYVVTIREPGSLTKLPSVKDYISVIKQCYSVEQTNWNLRLI